MRSSWVAFQVCLCAGGGPAQRSFFLHLPAPNPAVGSSICPGQAGLRAQEILMQAPLPVKDEEDIPRHQVLRGAGVWAEGWDSSLPARLLMPPFLYTHKCLSGNGSSSPCMLTSPGDLHGLVTDRNPTSWLFIII